MNNLKYRELVPFLLVAVVAVAFLIQRPPSNGNGNGSQNLVVNGGFEDGEIGWQGWGELTYKSATISSESVYSGNFSARLWGLYELGQDYMPGLLAEVPRDKFLASGAGEYRIEARTRGNGKGILVMDFGCIYTGPDSPILPSRVDIPVPNDDNWLTPNWTFNLTQNMLDQWTLGSGHMNYYWFDIRIDPNQNVPEGTEILCYVDNFSVTKLT